MPSTTASASGSGSRAGASASWSTSTTRSEATSVITGVIVHLLNEQPIVVDLLEMPKPSDAGLVCTNVRTLDGRKPIFVDRGDSTFFFPYLNVRFIEILQDRSDAGPVEGEASKPADEGPAEEDEDL